MHTEETKRKIRESTKKSTKNIKGRFKKGNTIGKNTRFVKGHKHSKKTRDKISESQKGIPKPKPEGWNVLDKHPNWQGGKSFEIYPSEFNKELKNKTKERDNFTCQECKFTQKELKHPLEIHHIDYNKHNNIPENLISLCKGCHAQTNFGREDWTEYFQGWGT